MDARTGKIHQIEGADRFDPTNGLEFARDKDGKIIRDENGMPCFLLTGENCTGLCALANKRNCYIRDPKFRALCKDFRPTRRNCG